MPKQTTVRPGLYIVRRGREIRIEKAVAEYPTLNWYEPAYAYRDDSYPDAILSPPLTQRDLRQIAKALPKLREVRRLTREYRKGRTP